MGDTLLHPATARWWFTTFGSRVGSTIPFSASPFVVRMASPTTAAAPWPVISTSIASTPTFFGLGPRPMIGGIRLGRFHRGIARGMPTSMRPPATLSPTTPNTTVRRPCRSFRSSIRRRQCGWRGRFVGGLCGHPPTLSPTTPSTAGRLRRNRCEGRRPTPPSPTPPAATTRRSRRSLWNGRRGFRRCFRGGRRRRRRGRGIRGRRYFDGRFGSRENGFSFRQRG